MRLLTLDGQCNICGGRVRDAREKAGLSQEQLAAKIQLNCNACKIRYAMRSPNHPRSSTQLSHMDRTAFSRTSVEHSSLSDTQSIFRLSFQP